MHTVKRDERRKPVVRRLVDKIFSGSEDAASQRALAESACYSEAHTRRMFVAETGESIGACKRRSRLEWAAGRLSTSDDPISLIALAAGYKTRPGFTKAFRALLGMSPSQFRNKNRGPSRLMPGFLCRDGSPSTHEVGLYDVSDNLVTVVYDHNSVQAKIFPDGHREEVRRYAYADHHRREN